MSAADALLDRLNEQAAEIARYNRHLTAQRKRRDLLIEKLLRLEIPERTIASRSGVSFARVHQIKVARAAVVDAEEPTPRESAAAVGVPVEPEDATCNP